MLILRGEANLGKFLGRMRLLAAVGGRGLSEGGN